MGQALFTLGRYDESLDEFRRACDVDPRADGAHRALAQTLRRRHQYPEALERIKIAVSVALQPADALATWGEILVDLSQYREAQEKYQECLYADPCGVRGLVGIANVMQRSGRYQRRSPRLTRRSALIGGTSEHGFNLSRHCAPHADTTRPLHGAMTCSR